jgi:predicted phosphodiesterase
VKVLAIPDPHGFDHWKTVIDRVGEFDKIIFLGDYFDSFTVSHAKQMVNFQDILAFAGAYQSKVELCIGNHDLAYLTGQRCSGYQREHKKAIKEILLKNLDRLNVVYRHGDWLFSHAGFSKLWMKEQGLQNPESANGLLRRRPSALGWVGPDMFGDNPDESPVWIRPNSLIMNGVDGFNQCAGHTEIKPELEPKGIVQSGNKYLFVDTEGHNEFATIEVSGDF